jgi:hypothetical protein
MANPNIAQLVVTTLNNYKKSITDNIQNSHPLFMLMKERGGIIKESGGNAFQENISYQSNGTVQAQGEYDTYNTTPQDVLSAATFNPKIITGTVTMTSLEMKKNAGKERIINLLDEKMRNLEYSLKNEMGTQIYGDGTGSGGKDIGGLQYLVSDDPTTGTVGGIDRATYAIWRNQKRSFTTESVVASATTIEAMMQKLFLDCQVQNSEQPDLIMADRNYFTFFFDSQLSIKRIVNDDSGAMGGFRTLAWNGAKVVYDVNCPTNHMYFLNTKYIFLKHLGDFFDNMGSERPVNQGVFVTPLEFTGNMTVSNSRVHGVLKA